ncbi:MAG: ABC transporter substrate-binding protein [Lachnospiraceae bacterium]|nr:ABC transporter substrate-binding protein [Lachnospiraceae bacterium]
MNRNEFLKTLLAAGMLFPLAACSSSGSKEPVSGEDTESETAEKVKLTVLRAGTDTDKKAFYEKVITQFEAENPDIEIEYQESAYGDDFETKLNTGFASGTAPDVMEFTLASMGTRVPLGQYASLDTYVESWDGKDDYMESALNLGSINGSVYGIAVQPDVRMLIYNRELFEEAGLDPDSPPTNWEELAQYHKTLIRYEDSKVVQTGLGIPTSGSNLQHYLSIFLFQNGVKNLVDEDTDTILFHSEEGIEAAQFIADLIGEGVIFWNSTNSDENPFASGNAAMTFAGTADFDNWNSGALTGKIAYAAPLTHVAQGTFCGMSFLFMSGETKHPQEAWRFIEYMASADIMWERYETLGAIPVRESLKEQFIAGDPDANTAIYESIAVGIGSPKVAYANSIFNAVNDAMERIAYGVEDVETSLNKAAKELQKEIDSQ